MSAKWLIAFAATMSQNHLGSLKLAWNVFKKIRRLNPIRKQSLSIRSIQLGTVRTSDDHQSSEASHVRSPIYRKRVKLIDINVSHYLINRWMHERAKRVDLFLRVRIISLAVYFSGCSKHVRWSISISLKHLRDMHGAHNWNWNFQL